MTQRFTCPAVSQKINRWKKCSVTEETSARFWATWTIWTRSWKRMCDNEHTIQLSTCGKGILRFVAHDGKKSITFTSSPWSLHARQIFTTPNTRAIPIWVWTNDAMWQSRNCGSKGWHNTDMDSVEAIPPHECTTSPQHPQIITPPHACITRNHTTHR